MRHGPALVQANRSAFQKHDYRVTSMQPLHQSRMATAADLDGGKSDDGLGISISDQASIATTRPEPIPVSQDIALHHIPEGLDPEYRPLPTVVHIGIWLVSCWLSALSVFRKLQLSWIRPLFSLYSGKSIQWSKILSFVLKTVVLALSFTTVLQDLLLPPSRITTQTLIDNFFLPSNFSHYEQIAQDKDGNTTQGVHYLLCKAGPSLNNTGIVYLNHGFGASSLSWLPAMKPMMDKFRYRVAVAHDAPGFGFTDRPQDGLESYTSRVSAQLGCNLFNSLHYNNEHEDKKVLLMGHSMGAMTTLRMALSLPSHVEKRIVLVDPALGIRPNQGKTAKAKKLKTRAFTNFFFDRILEPLGSYALRRAVGRPGFWKAGLQFVWGDSSRLTDTDVLRYQWPGITKGWEKGLLKFTRAQLMPMDVTDRDLFQQVLALPNTTISVIFGSNDSIVKPAAIQTFFSPYKDKIKLVELEGLGHDPFEEDIDAFLSALETVLT